MHGAAVRAGAGFVGVHAVQPDAIWMVLIRVEVAQRRGVAGGIPLLAVHRAGMAADAGVQVDDQAEFRWALARLPARQRAVLVLRYWSDLPVAEVADILGCTEGTVTSTASRAAARLAEILTRAKPPATRPAAPHT